MKPSEKRTYSDPQATIIFKVFAQKHYRSSNAIVPETHAKETEDPIMAESYYNELLKELTQTTIHLELLAINEKNEIIYSELLQAENTHS